MARRAGSVTACLVLLLVLASPTRALLVHSYTLADLARETEMAVIVKVDKVTPLALRPGSPFELKAALIEATVLAQVAGEYRIDLEKPESRSLSFIAGGRVWANKRPRYELRPGQHWFVCLRGSDFTEEYHVVLNTTNDEGPLSAVPVPPDVLELVVKEIGDIEKSLEPGDDTWRLVVAHCMRELLGDATWSGTAGTDQDFMAVRLFHGLLKLHHAVLSSKQLFDYYSATRLLGADETGTPIFSLGEGLALVELVKGVGGLQLRKVGDPLESAVGFLEPEAQEDVAARLKRADSRRIEALVLAKRMLEVLHEAVMKDPRVRFYSRDVDCFLFGIDSALGREHKNTVAEDFDLSATVVEYLDAVRAALRDRADGR